LVALRNSIEVDEWLYVPRAAALAGLRLFCFPPAGMGAAYFRTWAGVLSDGVELHAVQLPGRTMRLAEPPLTSIPNLVEPIVSAISVRLDRPAIFFGHSMGAVLATEVAREFMTRNFPSPVHLFVSGRRPPHMPDPMSPLHALPDDAFIAEINRRYGGIPPAILGSPEVLALLLPALRADIMALETFPAKLRAALSIPISVFGGDCDPLTPRSHLDAWKSETTGPVETHLFPGGHFYLERETRAVIATMLKTISLPLARRPDGSA
jgi:medium-chain acyl-[acyl-carrier-protein] hydrolase